LNTENQKTISTLLEKLQELKTEQIINRTGSNIGMAIEEPIAWTKIFNFDINRYFTDAEFYFEQTLRQKIWLCENFPEYSAYIPFEMPVSLGYYPEYTFIGLKVTYNADGVPIIENDHPIKSCADVKLLKPVDFKTSGWMPRILKWYDDILKIAAGRIKVTYNMEWWRGCLDQAIELRGYENFISDTIERPGFVNDLLSFLAENRCKWHKNYSEYFGIKLKPASIGDDWINVPFITPTIFEDFVLPRYVDIERFHGSLEYLHSCGNQTPLQKSILKNLRTMQIYEISPWTDLDESLKNIPEDKKLNINLHPNDILVADETSMRNRLCAIRDKCRGRKYKVNTSGLTPITPDISEYVRCAKKWLETASNVLNVNTWE
jgi:hypothetical protein